MFSLEEWIHWCNEIGASDGETSAEEPDGTDAEQSSAAVVEEEEQEEVEVIVVGQIQATIPEGEEKGGEEEEKEAHKADGLKKVEDTNRT